MTESPDFSTKFMMLLGVYGSKASIINRRTASRRTVSTAMPFYTMRRNGAIYAFLANLYDKRSTTNATVKQSLHLFTLSNCVVLSSAFGVCSHIAACRLHKVAEGINYHQISQRFFFMPHHSAHAAEKSQTLQSLSFVETTLTTKRLDHIKRET